VSLHGTLETFALPDVLALLAATKKNGELHVVGGTTDGRVWFDAGNVVGTAVGASATFVDAVFELLRLESGKFSFDADKAAPSPSEPEPIQPLLDEAQSRLTEWRSIEAVVPSLGHGVGLRAELDEGPVTVTGDQWRALVGVATSPTVQSVVERLGVGEFETCRTLKGLVEAGLVTVEERAAAPAPAPPPVRAEAPAPAPVEARVEAPVEAPAKPKIQALTSTPAASAEELEAEAAPAPEPPKAKKAKPADQGEADELVRQVAALEATQPEAVPEAAPEAEAAEEPAAEGEEPINRGLLLKFLSSVRT
jgi:Domain of unknown function (DUF4388)